MGPITSASKKRQQGSQKKKSESLRLCSADEIKQEFPNAVSKNAENTTTYGSLMEDTSFAGHKRSLDDSQDNGGPAPFRFIRRETNNPHEDDIIEETPDLASSMLSSAVHLPALTQDDDVDTTTEEIIRLKASLKRDECENNTLKRTLKSVSVIGVVDESSLYSLRNTVKGQLFKRVKFMISETTTKDSMKFLLERMGIDEPAKRDWVNTYLHHVRATMNNKHNAVAQDLRRDLIGTLF